MTDDFPFVMTIEEASKYLCIPLSAIYKLVSDGKIPCQKVGRHWQFRKETIDHWLDKRSVISSKSNPYQSKETNEWNYEET